jgi:hypothetical protein
VTAAQHDRARGAGPPAERLWVDVTYWPAAPDSVLERVGTFGPFAARGYAEQALIGLAARPDVRQAHIRNPDE